MMRLKPDTTKGLRRRAWRSLPVWLSFWMLAVPLVHVHPDADHRHGTSDHLHGGTVHTVFSKDLTCEFSAHDHSSLTADESHHPFHFVAYPRHGLEHPEIEVVLAASTESQSGKGTLLEIAAHVFRPDDRLSGPVNWRTEPIPFPAILLLVTVYPPRAPPVV
jgi:hypothetical protein